MHDRSHLSGDIGHGGSARGSRQAPVAPLRGDRRGPAYAAAHHGQRRRLPRHRQRGKPLHRRHLLPVLREPRLLVRSRDGRGGGAPDGAAALLRGLVDGQPRAHQAGREGRVARARGHGQGVLHAVRGRVQRGGLEARPRVLLAEGRAPVEGDQPRGRLPRHDDGGAVADRHRAVPDDLRAARPRRRAPAQHEQLPAARGRDGGGVHGVPAGGSRAPDPRARPGHGRHGDPRARAEPGRLSDGAGRLLPRGAGRSATATTSCCTPTRSSPASAAWAPGSRPSSTTSAPT